MQNLKKHFLILMALALLAACTSQRVELENTQKLPVGVALKGNSGIIVDASQPMWHTSNCGDVNTAPTFSLVDIDKMIASHHSLTAIHQRFKKFLDATAEDVQHCTSRQIVGIKFLELYNEREESIASAVPCYYLDLLLEYETFEPALMHTSLEKIKKNISKKSYHDYQQKILVNAQAALQSVNNEIDFGIEELAQRKQEYISHTQEVIKKLSR